MNMDEPRRAALTKAEIALGGDCAARFEVKYV